MKPKLLIRVDANEKIGWGHFFRCLALAQMVTSSFDVVFAASAPPLQLKRTLDTNGLDLIELPYFGYTSPQDQAGEEIPFDLDEFAHEYQIILLDGYWFGERFQSRLREFPVKIAILEDQGAGEYKADLVLNHAPGLTRSAYNIDNNDVKFALGPKYALLRPLFLNEAKRQINQGQTASKNRVLVSFGGSDYFNFSKNVSKWILEKTDYNITLIVGSSYNHEVSLRELAIQYEHRLSILASLTEGEMLEQMLLSDVGVFPASGLLFESLACRLPIISGLSAGNQNSIYQGFLELGAFYDANNFSEQALNVAFGKINSATNDKMRLKYRTIIDGESSERIRLKFECLV